MMCEEPSVRSAEGLAFEVAVWSGEPAPPTPDPATRHSAGSSRADRSIGRWTAAGPGPKRGPARVPPRAVPSQSCRRLLSSEIQSNHDVHCAHRARAGNPSEGGRSEQIPDSIEIRRVGKVLNFPAGTDGVPLFWAEAEGF